VVLRLALDCCETAYSLNGTKRYLNQKFNIPSMVLFVEPCTEYRWFKPHRLWVFTVEYNYSRHMEKDQQKAESWCVQ